MAIFQPDRLSIILKIIVLVITTISVRTIIYSPKSMKKLFVLCLVFIGLSTFAQTTSNVNLTLSTDDPEIEKVEISRPINQIYLWLDKKEVIAKSENGTFEASFSLEQAENVHVKVGNARFKMILEPAHAYQVKVMNGEPTYGGDNARGMELLNQLPPPYLTVNEAQNFKTDTTALLLGKRIKDLKSVKIQRMEKMLADKSIDADFVELISKEINYLYAGRIAKLISVKQIRSFPLTPDWEKLMKQTIEAHPVETQPLPSNWYDYAETVVFDRVIYEALKKEEISLEKLKEMGENDEVHPYQTSLALQQLNKEYAEKLLAQYIMSSAKQKHFEKSLIGVFKTFTQTFPQSIYTSYLKPEIDIIRAYHEKISGGYAAGISFLEGENPESLEQLLDRFKGKKALHRHVGYLVRSVQSGIQTQ